MSNEVRLQRVTSTDLENPPEEVAYPETTRRNFPAVAAEKRGEAPIHLKSELRLRDTHSTV